MCRLALMNRASVELLGSRLSDLFVELESSFGGDGNGIAGLWSKTGHVRSHKDLTLVSVEAAARIQHYTSQGADWVLFHTRYVTSGARNRQSCHPFQRGDLVLAHNGHAANWDFLGKSMGLSDSQCIASIWSCLHAPLTALKREGGVFVGFCEGKPFAVKGTDYDDLTLSVHEETGAILFASELSKPFRHLFDRTIEVSSFFWHGTKLDLSKIEPRRIRRPSYKTGMVIDHSSTSNWDRDATLVPDREAAHVA